jgi:Asp/Glu/hydantoin racemase
MTLRTGGRTLYGFSLGMMMMDTRFPRVWGDIGNARTWPFPVTYRVVRGATPDRLATADPDMSLLDPFIEVVRDLETDGVPAILTSCGFLAAFQRELAEAASVPVFSSSLLQVPLAAQAIGRSRRVGIMTARAVLTERHFSGVGFSSDDIPVVQVAPADDSHFNATFVGDAPEADPEVLDAEIGELAKRLVAEHADVGAIVLECANLAPFAPTVRRVTGLPVFDLYTLGMHAHHVASGTDFAEGGFRA